MMNAVESLAPKVKYLLTVGKCNYHIQRNARITRKMEGDEAVSAQKVRCGCYQTICLIYLYQK